MSNEPPSRFKRYSKISGALSGAATRYVGERFFGISIDHDSQAQTFTRVMGNLKGPIMKIAQFLATVPGAIPEEYAEEFQQLQSEAPAMGGYFVRRRLQGELGADWHEKFLSFDEKTAAAASLGQVHRAVSPEGDLLACKLQYPDMASVIESDIKQLKLGLKLYESTLGALKTEELFIEISDRLKEEVDYRLEAKNILYFQDIFKDDPSVHIPKVYSELSTGRLLTLSWLEGRSLRNLENHSQDFKNRIAKTLFEAWYKPLYHHGVIHGDPHMGNYTFRDDASLNLLDFGCVRYFHASFVESIIDLYRALENNSETDLVAAYESWGFTNLSKELVEALTLWAKMLYDPLLENRVRPIKQDISGVEGREIAARVHAELRRLGGVTPPREFVFLDRAAVGIGAVFMRLGAEQNWHRLFMELIEGRTLSSEETLADS